MTKQGKSLSSCYKLKSIQQKAGGGGLGMGSTCVPVADSFWCVAEPIQYCKVKKKKKSRFWCDLVQPLYHPFPQRVIHRETLRIPTIPWFRQQQHSRHKTDKKKSTEEINKNMDSVRQGLKQNKTHLLQSWNLTNHKMNREVRREELMWH